MYFGWICLAVARGPHWDPAKNILGVLSAKEAGLKDLAAAFQPCAALQRSYNKGPSAERWFVEEAEVMPRRLRSFMRKQRDTNQSSCVCRNSCAVVRTDRTQTFLFADMTRFVVSSLTALVGQIADLLWI